MIVDFSKVKIQDRISLPISKSIANRMLVIRALSNQSLPGSFRNEPNDTTILRQLLNSKSTIKNAGIAGTAFRFLTAYFSQKKGKHLLTGEERMLERPIAELVETLQQLGAKINYAGEVGFPPLEIDGSILEGGYAEIKGNISSQFISALLMIGPMMINGLQLKVLPPFYSKPYVNMTMALMSQCGVEFSFENDIYSVANQHYKNVLTNIESDWSAASYWYELVAVGAVKKVELLGLESKSLQGDAVCKELFKTFGVESVFSTTGVYLKKVKKPLPEFLEFNCIDCPDLVQTIVCTCAALNIKAKILGIETLRSKETDRVQALINELAKLGITCVAEQDSFSVVSFSQLKSNTINTYNDHRMAMAFAPLAFKFGPLEILNPEVTSKSYPNFWKDLGC